MTTTDDTRRRTWRMKPRTRKLVLLVHVVSSVGWLGVNIADLTLAIAGMLTDDPATQHAAFHALLIVGGTLLIPISLLALISGLVLSVGTQWGLLRYKWVIVKLVLTSIAVVLIPLSLLPGLRDLSALASATPADQLADVGKHASSILSAGVVSTSMYVTNTIMSVLKPFGRTRRHPARAKLATA